LTLGPIGGGAIKLDPDENVTQGLCVGEGAESCLAGLKYDLRPVWSLISASGIAKFPVLPGIECLTIFRENDEANARAVAECTDRWLDAGREVIGADPPPDCKDINNLIVKEAQNASRA
jgi:putative DNA primase/helicase